MSRLSVLLDEPERKMRKIIAKLEDLSGYKSEDVRLLADMNVQLKNKVELLGLDPADTTGEELYESLKVKLSNDLSQLDRAWGLNGSGDSQKIIQVLEQVALKDDILAIKCVAIKGLFKASPPKKTMKLLGYRSVESMLKREDTRQVLSIALNHESNLWNSRVSHKISRLKSSDYEFRKIKFIASRNTAAVTRVPLMAAVCLPESSAVSSAGHVLMALQAEANLVSESRYLSSHQFSNDFGLLAQRIFINHPIVGAEIAGESFISPHELMQIDKPRLPHDDFARLHPTLSWWKSTAHLALEDGRPVSLHIGDCLENLVQQLDYESRKVHNFSAELKRQLISRYCNYDSVKNYISGPIDDTFITLDSISTKQLVPEFEENFS